MPRVIIRVLWTQRKNRTPEVLGGLGGYVREELHFDATSWNAADGDIEEYDGVFRVRRALMPLHRHRRRNRRRCHRCVCVGPCGAWSHRGVRRSGKMSWERKNRRLDVEEWEKLRRVLGERERWVKQEGRPEENGFSVTSWSVYIRKKKMINLENLKNKNISYKFYIVMY